MNLKKWYLQWEWGAKKNDHHPFICINNEVNGSAITHVVYVAHTESPPQN